EARGLSAIHRLKRFGVLLWRASDPAPRLTHHSNLVSPRCWSSSVQARATCSKSLRHCFVQLPSKPTRVDRARATPDRQRTSQNVSCNRRLFPDHSNRRGLRSSSRGGVNREKFRFSSVPSQVRQTLVARSS